MDTLRDGTFQLANTNKLIRFYEGATGLKNRLHRRRLYVSPATAKDGMELIAVVLGSPTSADRFETAKALLNYGFAGYSLGHSSPSEPISPFPSPWAPPTCSRCSPRRAKFSFPRPRQARSPPPFPSGHPQAPVEKGQELGSLTVLVDGERESKLPLVAQEEVPRLTLWAALSIPAGHPLLRNLKKLGHPVLGALVSFASLPALLTPGRGASA